MAYTTLISTAILNEHLREEGCGNALIVVFSLADTEQGRQSYEQDHIPGALYAHLDEDLSGPIIPGQTGRHPLPDVEVFAKTLSGWGIDHDVQVVAYDNMGGAVGRPAVVDAPLAGARRRSGSRWRLAGLARGGDAPPKMRSGLGGPASSPRRPHPERLVDAEMVMTVHTDPTYRLLDARSADRFRGENETLDPVGGHIPGAISAPFAENLEEGRFRSAAALQDRFEALLGDVPPEQTVMYCGSGVTAAHNLLALAHAGLGDARLYAGSWSEWLANPKTKGAG